MLSRFLRTLKIFLRNIFSFFHEKFMAKVGRIILKNFYYYFLIIFLKNSQKKLSEEKFANSENSTIRS